MRASVCRVKGSADLGKEADQGIEKAQRTDKVTQDHRCLGLAQASPRDAAEISKDSVLLTENLSQKLESQRKGSCACWRSRGLGFCFPAPAFGFALARIRRPGSEI